jgi:microcystin-dependent protein
MVKVEKPLFSGDVRGAFGKKIIFTRGNQARIYFSPRNPKSAAQEAQREYFKENFVSKQEAFPVGSGFITFVDTDPSELLGYGVWEQVGKGRVLVGKDPEQAEFDEIGKEGGEKEHDLTVSEMPAHPHTQVNHTHTVGFNNVDTTILGKNNSTAGSSGRFMKSSTTGSNADVSANGEIQSFILSDATPAISSAGGGLPHNNLQPFLVAMIWKRTA